MTTTTHTDDETIIDLTDDDTISLDDRPDLMMSTPPVTSADVVRWLKRQTGGTLGDRTMRARAIELLDR